MREYVDSTADIFTSVMVDVHAAYFVRFHPLKLSIGVGYRSRWAFSYMMPKRHDKGKYYSRL
jgi:hypothetical protein